MDKFIIGPDGRLGVWTGAGYDFSAPASFSSDALKSQWRGGEAGSQLWDSEAAMRQAYQNYSGDTPWADPYQTYYLEPGNGSGWSPVSSNYQLQYDPSNPNSLTLQMKSADKEGANIGYVRDPDTGKWTLDPNAVRLNYWDTNQLDNALRGYLMPVSVGLGAYGAAQALGLEGAISGAGAGAGAGLGSGSTILGDVTPVAGTVGYGATPGIEGLISGLGEVALPASELTYSADLPEGSLEFMKAAEDAATESSWLPSSGSYYGNGIQSLVEDLPYGVQYSAVPGTVEAGISPWEAINGWGAAGLGAGSLLIPAGASSSLGIGDFAGKVGDWIVKNPQLALTGIGALGSLIAGPSSPTSGAATSGSGSGSGWNGPIPQMKAVQARFAPPEGYRPGFSPEHVYIETAYTGGAPSESLTLGSNSGKVAPPDIPPLPPVRYADGGSVWTRPSGIAAIPVNVSPYPKFAGAAGGPAYVYKEPAGLQTLFDYLNTQPTAAPRLVTTDQGLGTQYARWAQAGHNPTLINNAVRSTGTLVPVGATRAGFGGYGVPRFAGGGYVQGPGTGTSDSIPAIIDGDKSQPAALSTNEFVFPEWLVEEIGNGSADAGAQRLYNFMAQMKAKHDSKAMSNPDTLLSQLA